MYNYCLFRRFTHKDIFEEVFNQSESNGGSQKHTSSNKKSIIIRKFKDSDAPIRLSVIDTSVLFRKEKRQINGNTAHDESDRGIKTAFGKCFQQFNGGVISFQVFDADSTRNISCGNADLLHSCLQFSTATSSILKSYQQSAETNRRRSMDRTRKEKICKLRLCQYTGLQVKSYALS